MYKHGTPSNVSTVPAFEGFKSAECLLFESGFEFCCNDVLDFGLNIIVFLCSKLRNWKRTFCQRRSPLTISVLNKIWTPNSSKKWSGDASPRGNLKCLGWKHVLLSTQQHNFIWFSQASSTFWPLLLNWLESLSTPAMGRKIYGQRR